MANKNITQLTQQTGSADTTSLFYTVTGGNTDKSLPLSVLFNGPTFTDTVTYSGPILGTSGTPITLPGNSNFYAPSAVISRFNDRVFVGDATQNNGTNVASQPDWLTTYQIAKGRSYGYVQTSQFSVLNTSYGDSLTTVVVGARTSTHTAHNVIAVTGMGVNDATTGGANNQAWAGYFEAFRDTGTAGNGGAYGIEIDTMNYVSAAAVTDPYSQSNDQTVSAQLAAGGGFPGTMYPTTVGINFQNNNSTFDKGIVFGSNSITGATGTSGTGIAIAFGRGHTIQWYGSAGVTTSSILSTGTLTAAAIQQLFSDNAVVFRNASSKTILNVQGVSSGVNGIQVLGSSTGNAVAVQAVGDDTNIPLQLSSKGSGTITLNNPTVVSGTITPTAIVGVTTNSNAATGQVGEYVSNSATGVSLTSGTNANITSISLTAGDWDVTGTVTFVPANTTAPTLMECGISTTSATLAGLGTVNFLNLSFPTNGSSQGFVAPRQRISIAATTTVYLVAVSTFTVSTMTANGFISARRMR